MKQHQVQIINRLGLHARAAAKLVELAAGFECECYVVKHGTKADAKSIMGVMMLAATMGTHLEFHTDGRDEEAALQALAELIEDKCGEAE